MPDWRTETGLYLRRIESILDRVDTPPPHPSNVPRGLLEIQPTELQGALHRALSFLQIGIWVREREVARAIRVLWVDGLLASAASLVRISFELWAAAAYTQDAIAEYDTSRDLHRFTNKIDRLFEGVRAEVVMPWGTPALERPVHVLDTVRALTSTYSDAMSAYEQLCESAHANQPRFLEWWLLGSSGDNWSNETAKSRGHDLIEHTIASYERSAEGLVNAVFDGTMKCGQLY